MPIIIIFIKPQRRGGLLLQTSSLSIKLHQITVWRLWLVRVLSLRSGVIHGVCDRALTLPSCPVFMCSSHALSHLHALFRDRAWCLDPGTHVLSFSSVWTLALHVLFCCVSVRSRVCSAVRSPVLVVHAVCVFIGCMHSCYVLCCVARSLYISLAACFHVVMSCVLACLCPV